MEEKRKLSTMAVVHMLLIMLFMMNLNLPALACPPDGSGCKDCIVKRMKSGCPPCVPIMRCMARCLWGGSSRTKCIKKCDCNDGYPRLSDCKKCLSQCKCSCSVY